MRKIIISLILISLYIPVASALDTLSVVALRDIPVEYQILATKGETVKVEDVLTQKWQSKFQDPSNFNKTSPNHFYWLKLDFKGQDLSKAEQWALFVGLYCEMVLYHKEGDGYGVRRSGILIPDKSSAISPLEELPFRKSDLFEGRYLYIKLRHTMASLPFPQTLFYSSFKASKIFNNLLSMEEVSYAVPTFLFIGGIVVMMFYSFGIFFLYRDKGFLYYSFYLLALVLYLGRKTFTLYFFVHYPQIDYIFNEVIQVIVNIAYLSFILNFINAKKDYPLLYKVSKYIIGFLVMVISAELVLLSNNIFSPLQVYLINFERYFMALFALIGVLYILFTLKDKASLFIIVGSFCFIGGAMLSLLMSDVRLMMAGAIIEIFIFALGLGYKFQKLQKEKQRIEREMDQIKLTALKAQMNPHFIFNSLNSIRSYIIVNETRKASNYLIKFSKLIRLILQYASSDYITLKEEISTMKLYTALEQMRFRDRFDFNIEVDPRLNLERVQIPPLIFQPYIENAIWHGLTPKSGEKSLTLTIEECHQEMVCTIRDNGVGRAFAENLRPKDPNKKSMALSLTKDRINLISQDSSKTNVSIRDLVHNGKPAGTEVKFILPLIEIAA